MHISILICTCNRAEALRATLASLAAVCIPADLATELVIVDNGSTDHTEQVVKEAKLPRLEVRYFKEPRKGKCFALNTGIKQARGEALLFTDDDVRLPQDWVVAMCEPILSRQADGVAGGVRLAEHLQRPWMTPIHRAMLADTEDTIKRDPQMMVGANMALARAVFQTLAFDTEIGPGAMGIGEETLLKRQFDKAGFTTLVRRDVCVEHHPDSQRLRRAGFLRAGEVVGRFQGYSDHHWHHSDPKMPRLRLLRWQLQLALWHAAHPGERRREEGIDTVELHYIFYIYKFKQYLTESRRPRNYAREGLAKLTA